jgi:putative hydrolase of the HAD superfamily
MLRKRSSPNKAGPRKRRADDGMISISTIGFDADDTLWRHADFYLEAENRLTQLLSDHEAPAGVIRNLREVERKNLALYGFGAKGFTLSMIETALALAGAHASKELVAEIVAAGQELIRHPIELLPHVRETLALLASSYRLILITRGDLFDQERKLAASGLVPSFHAVEIVSDKNAATYGRVFSRYGDGPERAMMAGNSLRSDIVPALEAGSWGVHVPQENEWVIECADPPLDAPRFRSIRHLGELPETLTALRVV